MNTCLYQSFPPTGLNECDRAVLCAEVNIIFHSAATVSLSGKSPKVFLVISLNLRYALTSA